MSIRKFIELPPHNNPSPERRSHAPYNFIPLPKVVVSAVEKAEQLPDQNSYANTKYPHSGYFDVTLTTKSPLYVRCPLTQQEYDLDQQGLDRHGEEIGASTAYADRLKNKADFFYTEDGSQPVIPGSSLRGMLRSVLEILSYGKVELVSDGDLFYRAVGDRSSLGESYRQRMQQRVQGGYCPKAQAGYLTKAGNSYSIVPAVEILGTQYFRVEESVARAAMPSLIQMRQRKTSRSGRVYYEPNPSYDWLRKQIWFQPVAPVTHRHHSSPMNYGNVTHLSDAKPAVGGWEEGVFIASGWIPAKYPKLGKHLHWIINLKSSIAPIPVNDRDIVLYKDGGGLTDRIKSEGLTVLPKDGEEVACFYVEWKDGKGQPRVTFGHTPYFRLPYEGTPLDYVPTELRQDEVIDYAEAIFGYTKNKGVKKTRAYASRVFMTDAELKEAPDGLWLSEAEFTPDILATPKPTCFQHYLVQQEPDEIPNGTRQGGSTKFELRLRHYASPTHDQTVIRGYKLYWHQGDKTAEALTARLPNNEDSEATSLFEQDENGEWRVKPTSTQHTVFKPVRSNVSFKFRVYFENLSDAELGAMCWALQPRGEADKTYCHKLGMGKPFGLGSVQLVATLHRIDRAARYKSLFEGQGWQTGTDSIGESVASCIEGSLVKKSVDAFEEHMRTQLNFKQDEWQGLGKVKRIAALLRMMEWGRFLSENDVAYPTLKEFKERKVLPDPLFNESDEWIDGLLIPNDNPEIASIQSQAPARPAAGTTAGLQQLIKKSETQAKPIARIEIENVTLLTPVSRKRNADVMTAGGRVQCREIKNTYQLNVNSRLVAKVVYEGERAKEAVWVKNL